MNGKRSSGLCHSKSHVVHVVRFVGLLLAPVGSGKGKDFGWYSTRHIAGTSIYHTVHKKTFLQFYRYSVCKSSHTLNEIQGRSIFVCTSWDRKYENLNTHLFEASEPPEPWSGVLDATRQPSECAGYCPVRDMVVGQDDCLYLKVFTKDLNKDARKAVLVFFHGGYYYFGSSDTSYFGPDYLIEHEIVLVLVDFRIGPFGWYPIIQPSSDQLQMGSF